MPYWLCYMPCIACDGQCVQCEHSDLPVSIFVANAPQRPSRALNGPCVTADELLGVMSNCFTFGADGFLRLKDMGSEANEEPS